MSTGSASSKRHFKMASMPRVFMIFFIILVATALLPHLVPAGMFERVSGPGGGQIINSRSFKLTGVDGVSFFDVFRAISIGFVESAGIIALTLIGGGTFAVIRSTCQ